eukprot:TRINITY_DN412_c0_g1_i2.p1 TRINITY_DN412_c0_g1~~TRINITY_DN412_c0_g1_i2.p1  ORF type:complete len:328 (-),score=89.96 TRINITY_DN412_c0_g1_i2:158-1141(-)
MHYITWEWDDLQWDYGAIPSSLIVNRNTVTITAVAGTSPGAPATLRFADPLENGITEIKNAIQTVDSTYSGSLGVWAVYGFGTSILYVGGYLLPNTTYSFAPATAPPDSHFAHLLHNHLEKAGMSVSTDMVGHCDVGNPTWRKVYDHASQPAYVIMNDTLQWSVNINAEIFLNLVGVALPQYPSPIAAVAAVLTSLGVDPTHFSQTDGSGLSRHNELTPLSLSQLLWALSGDAEFVSLLPVAGQSGTLTDRFVGTPADGVVHAKTGTITGASALSGYAAPAGARGDTLVFSVVVNDSCRSTAEQRATIDQVVVLVAELSGPCATVFL